MLASLQDLQNVPGFQLVRARPTAWVNSLLKAADWAVKKWCKRDLELTAYDEMYDVPINTQDIVIRQRPVWQAQATLAAASDGISLPQAVIYASSVVGFHPGTTYWADGQDRNPPALSIQVGVNTWTWVTYTGVADDVPGGGPRFTGCSGGSGTMRRNPAGAATPPWSIFSPVVLFDPQAMGNQVSSAFGSQTQLAPGSSYWIVPDVRGGDQSQLPLGVVASNRGILRRGSMGSMGFGFFPSDFQLGKLGGTRLAGFPRSQGALRVMYCAGFRDPPDDLRYAVAMMCAQMVRIQPKGDNLSSENTGAYGYSLLTSSNEPEFGTIRMMLRRWREVTI